MAKAPAPPKAPSPPALAAVTSSKRFSVAPWSRSNEGKKIIGYAPSGLGKTTLAAMAPNPVFLGTDDGGGLTCNPQTGEPVQYVPEVTGFGDVKAVLQSDLFDPYDSIVLDTGTNVQHWALPYMFTTIKHEKGHTVDSIEKYGYGKGYRHFFDLMHGLLVDFDRLIRRGKNVIILCQSAPVSITNTSGENYLKDGPDLYHSDKCSVRNDWIAWADYVFRITWENAVVDERKIAPVSGRMINTRPDASFEAKARGTLFKDYPAVTFSEPADDSLWRILFGGE
jgi:hypothetical protein